MLRAGCDTVHDVGVRHDGSFTLHRDGPARSLWLRAVVHALRLLPQNAISRLAGRIAGIRLPRWLAPHVVRLFGSAVGVDFAEVRDPIESFGSLQAFFTRALVPGVRPIDAAPDAFVSPCDGAWGESGLVREGRLLQVKGRAYALAELLGDADDARAFEGGSFATLYLSPRDYHRFHAPCSLRALRLRYLPGALWPVNRIGVEGVEALFARNERICAFFAAGEAGCGTTARTSLCIVAVGATMVGGVRVRFDTLTTQQRDGKPETREYGTGGARLAKGEEWGRFEFGSTLVLVAAPGLLTLDPQPPGTSVRLGMRLATLAMPWTDPSAGGDSPAAPPRGSFSA